MKKRKMIIIGSGGHARVLIDIIKQNNEFEICGYIDVKDRKHQIVNGIEVIGSDTDLLDIYRQGIKYAAIGVGSIKNNTPRNKLFRQVNEIGFTMANLIHNTAVISEDVALPDNSGIQIMSGVLINPGVSIGTNTVIDSGSIIEHDCSIANDSYIAPGTTISGTVSIGENCFVGAGTTIIQNITVGSNSVIGAGSTVVKKIPCSCLALGSPARVIRQTV